MRGLMLIGLFTLAYAAPQGYNYPNTQRQPHLQYGSASATVATDFLKDLQAVTAVQSANVDEQNFASGNAFLTNDIEQYSTSPQARFLATAIETNGLQTSYEPATSQFSHHQSTSYDHSTPIISKRFYLHSAPEDEEEDVQQRFLTVGKPRKNYNVVFIRSPSKSVHRASLKISPAVNEERTVIYVLAKKQDATEINAQVHEAITTTAKPEVFFIKYKTHEEAEHAQRSIQAQYDALGGSTHVSNEGIAPVSSVIGSLDTTKYASENDAQFVGGVADVDTDGPQQAVEEFISNLQTFQDQQVPTEQVTNTNNGYLPPAKKYRL